MRVETSAPVVAEAMSVVLRVASVEAVAPVLLVEPVAAPAVPVVLVL
jgi:hypothetical protein